MSVKWLNKFTRNTFSRYSSDVFRIVCACAMPALLMRMDGVPRSVRIAEAVEETEEAEVMSHL